MMECLHYAGFGCVSGQEASAHLHNSALEPQGPCHVVYPPASVCPGVCCPEEHADLHNVKRRII